jgi:hypothetical protein
VRGLPGDHFADGGDFLGDPAGQGHVGGGVVGAAVDKAGRVVVQVAAERTGRNIWPPVALHVTKEITDG